MPPTPARAAHQDALRALQAENERLRAQLAALRRDVADADDDDAGAGDAGSAHDAVWAARLARLGARGEARLPPARNRAAALLEQHGARLTGLHRGVADLLRLAADSDLRAAARRVRALLAAPDGAPYKRVLRAACGDGGVRRHLLREATLPQRTPVAHLPVADSERAPARLILDEHVPDWERLLRLADDADATGSVLFVLFSEAAPPPPPELLHGGCVAAFGAPLARAHGLAWGFAPLAVRAALGAPALARLLATTTTGDAANAGTVVHVRPAPLLLALWAFAHGDKALAAHLRQVSGGVHCMRSSHFASSQRGFASDASFVRGATRTPAAGDAAGRRRAAAATRVLRWLCAPKPRG
jgi:hypothetical protein